MVLRLSLPPATLFDKGAQAVLLASSHANRNQTSALAHACRPFWDSVEARLNPCIASKIFFVPLSIAVLLLLDLFRSTVLPIRAPVWTRNFVKEEKVLHDDLPDGPRVTGRAFGFDVTLLLVSTVGMITAIVSVFMSTFWIDTFPEAATWALLSGSIALTKPKQTPPRLTIIFVLLFGAGLVSIFNDDKVPLEKTVPRICTVVLSGIGILVVLNMPLRHPSLPVDGISKPSTKPDSELRSPEDNLTLWQWMSVTWMAPVIANGKERQLHDSDVWRLPLEFQHLRLHDAFRQLKGSVFRRLLAANGLDLILTSILGVIELLSNLLVPVILQLLLRELGNPHSSRRAPVVYALLSLLLRMVAALADVFSLWYSRRTYERSRGEMITMLFEKTLARKVIGEQNPTEGESDDEQAVEKESASTGKIINIMRSDAYEIAQRFWEWQELVTQPVGLILSVILVWNLLGWSCLVGVLAIVVGAGINAYILRKIVNLEKERRAITDSKLKIISQFVEAIRHLRYNAWEQKWLDGVFEERTKELRLRLFRGILYMFFDVTNQLASGIFPALSFMAYTLIAKKPLRVDIAFPALQLFSMLEDNLLELPNLVQVLMNAWVAMGRIEAYMKEPELVDAVTTVTQISSEPMQIQNGSFAWPGKQNAILKNVSITIKPGLTVVKGKVGSGKTALLHALLGELDRLDGEYQPPPAVIGFCAQSPWLQNMSIRENILFSTPYDERRYKQVMAACCLNTDIAAFKEGDLSFIGENGVGLSGGQKARVALARAVYSNAPYLLLDDPISALDQQTAEAIVETCINGPLCHGRTVVLVTHRTDLCQNLATQVLVVADGVVSVVEDADELRQADDSVEVTERAEAVNGHLATTQSKNKLSGDDLDAPALVDDKFIEEEKRAHGRVKLRVYWKYIKAGRLRWWFGIIVTFILVRGLLVGQAWFLKAWGEAYDKQTTIVEIPDPFKDLPSPEVNIKPWLLGFYFFAVSIALFHGVSNLFVLATAYTAGKNMFKEIMYRISTASFRYFDITPVGRLMNRMTSDIGVIDGSISLHLEYVTWSVVNWVSSVVIFASVTPTFLICTVLITAAFVIIFLQFLPTSQSLRRLEMVSLTPLMANFGALAEGLLTVRAFRTQRQFQRRVIEVVDTFQKMDHFYWSLQTWLMVRFDTISAFSTLALTLLAIYTKMSAGLTAFALVAASGFVRSTHNLCRQYGNLEMDFTSVERVVELLEVEQEPEGDGSPPASWPTSGELVFENVSVRYAPHLDLVLRDISFRIPSGSNVAVIGRTGSGKSTLALALLAVVRPWSGSITLDNVDVCRIDPKELRKRVTFLAQEPMLFAGSMRENLDPLMDFSDAECTSVLQRLGSGYEWELNTRVEAGGKNLSQGQRQLVQLARAILRRSRLIILDEATASIDLGTSREVQDILREEMVGSTVVTIAHRVEAVSNADYCIQLDHGVIVQQGPTGRQN